MKKIKRAIISVSDKSNLRTILPILKKFNIEIISSVGTFEKIKALNYKSIEAPDFKNDKGDIFINLDMLKKIFGIICP